MFEVLGNLMKTFLVIVALVFVGFFHLVIAGKKDRAKYQEAVEDFVDDAFSGQDYRPDVEARRTYGVPSFTLRFSNDDEKNHAESNGITKTFLEKVQIMCNDIDVQGGKFDAEYAVAIISKDDEKRWEQRAEEYRCQNKK